ncbi:MAG: CBS domain-containing protein [Thermotogae bacterium]|nr:CBS domain-containing protein [Thermotogota bacterium]HOO74319.1 CBS domain-containing protein [Tepiditoga sp.]
MKAKDIMQRDLTAIMADETVERFIMICQRHGISALPVINPDYILVGYLSESGIISASLPGYLSLMESSAFIPDSHQFFKGLHNIIDKPVSEFMDDKPFKVYANDTVLHVADVMIKNKLKLIPVIDEENKLIGIIRRIGLLSSAAKGEILTDES